jgi:ribonuclease Z
MNAMTEQIDERTPLACEGSSAPLTTAPVVGTPSGPQAEPAGGAVAAGELRVTVLGSGDPFVRPS